MRDFFSIQKGLIFIALLCFGFGHSDAKLAQETIQATIIPRVDDTKTYDSTYQFDGEIRLMYGTHASNSSSHIFSLRLYDSKNNCLASSSTSNKSEGGTYSSYNDNEYRCLNFLGKDGDAEWVLGQFQPQAETLISYLLINSANGRHYLILLPFKDYYKLFIHITQAAKDAVINLNVCDSDIGIGIIADILLRRDLFFPLINFK